MKKMIFKNLLLCSLIILSTGNSFAKDNDNKKDKDKLPHGEAPFDLGLGILLAVGIGYGVKRNYEKKKSNQSSL